ncbi:shTK domain protein, partial [Teladorsagia circumcincta]
MVELDIRIVSSVTAVTTRACVDLVNPRTGRSDCPYTTQLCGDPRYRQVMQIQCPRTCGFCAIGGSTLAPPAVG